LRQSIIELFPELELAWVKDPKFDKQAMVMNQTKDNGSGGLVSP
jgi:hypothetical protein